MFKNYRAKKQQDREVKSAQEQQVIADLTAQYNDAVSKTDEGERFVALDSLMIDLKEASVTREKNLLPKDGKDAGYRTALAGLWGGGTTAVIGVVTGIATGAMVAPVLIGGGVVVALTGCILAPSIRGFQYGHFTKKKIARDPVLNGLNELTTKTGQQLNNLSTTCDLRNFLAATSDKTNELLTRHPKLKERFLEASIADKTPKPVEPAPAQLTMDQIKQKRFKR